MQLLQCLWVRYVPQEPLRVGGQVAAEVNICEVLERKKLADSLPFRKLGPGGGDWTNGYPSHERSEGWVLG